MAAATCSLIRSIASQAFMALTGAMTSEGPWDVAGKQMLGAAAEMIVAAGFALAGLPVFRPLADDRGVDLLVDRGAGRHLLVQVKSARVGGGTGAYVFLRKRYFPLDDYRALCLVVFAHDEPQPRLFLIPAAVWRAPEGPFVDRDYVGLKSEPEYGLSLNRTWREDLAAWEIGPQLALLRGEAAETSWPGFPK